jgi:hypothetical protein
MEIRCGYLRPQEDGESDNEKENFHRDGRYRNALHGHASGGRKPARNAAESEVRDRAP